MQPLVPVVLSGRYVRLEPLTLSHVPGLMDAATGPRETFLWTVVPEAEKAMHQYVEQALEEQRQGRQIPFATVDARTSKVVGSTRFCNVERWPWPPESPRARPPGCADAVEIGYTWLHPSAQRSAINTEAKRLMLAHAFEVWEVYRVTLKTDERNTRSRAAIERIGGRLDGLLRGHMPGADGDVRTSAVYSIVASEWPVVRARLDARLAAA
jgi:N-acetyltransferase